MKNIWTHNKFHLGDSMISLHLLRALAKRNEGIVLNFFTNACNIPQLAAMVEDVANIQLHDFETALWKGHRAESCDMWKNHADFWVKSANRWNWSAFHLEHAAWTTHRLGLGESPFTIREHLLFDYPALETAAISDEKYAFLLVNSEPHSGQFAPMAKHGSGYLNSFIRQLAKDHSVITTEKVDDLPCTRDCGYLLTQIGALSTRCAHHIMIATGPMWPTLNTHNHHRGNSCKRIVLLDTEERIRMPFIEQCASEHHLFEIAGREGWL